MMEFFQQLPHLEPYGNPQYFVYVIAATLPIFIGLFFKKRFAWYEVLVSLFFIVTMLVGGKTNQLAALGIYLCWEILLLLFYKHYRKSKDGKWVFYLVSFLSLLPIIFVKVQPAINGTQSLLGFLGISYLTFRSVGIIIELRDGVIKDFTLWEFLRFLLFMPTFSSGPIDRFKRFNENYQAIPERDELMDMLDEDLFDAGVLDSMGTVELIVEIENRFDIRVPVTEFGRDDWNTANKIIAGIVELQNA
ncbi:TPA: D-alanine--poly(phosphoribitol) ligase subunit DltC [Streptococcus pneumoniae]